MPQEAQRRISILGGVRRAWDIAISTITISGVGLLCGGIVATILAFTAHWREAGIVAVACGLSLIVALIWIIGRAPQIVSVELPQTRTVAGRTIIGELRVRNDHARPSRSHVIELPVGSGAAQFVVPNLAGRSSWSEVFAVPTRRRGIVTVGPPSSVRSDPVGLFRRVRAWTKPIRVYVHPRTVRVPFDATGFQADIEGVVTAKLSSSDVSFHALRDYQPGDDRRNVHWPTTARTGRLIVRQFEETRRSHHVIFIDTLRDHWEEEPFETALSIAASLALTGITASHQVSMATSSRLISTLSATRMLDELTEESWRVEDQDLSERLREVLTSYPNASVLTLIVPASVSYEEIARLCHLPSVDVIVGVIRVDPDAPSSRSSSSRAVVATCPTLESLPRMLARGGLR